MNSEKQEEVIDMAREWTKSYAWNAQRMRSIALEQNGPDVVELMFDQHSLTSPEGMNNLLDKCENGGYFNYGVLTGLEALWSRNPMIQGVCTATDLRMTNRGKKTRQQIIALMRSEGVML